MAELKDIRVTLSKSNFDVTVKKFDGKLTVTDPITVRNQIYELRNLADIPNVNTVNLVDGAMIIYNANNQLYEVRPLEKLNNLTVSNTLFASKISANGSVGANGRVLTSNGSFVYWSSLGTGTISGVIAANGLSGGGSTGVISLSVNTDYIATLTSNAAIYANVANYLNGKAENELDANTALFANIANYALSLNGVGAGDLNVNSAYYATIAATAITSNNALYAYGKQESQINANSALYLAGGGGWANPGAIGSTTPNTAVFTTIQHSGLIPTQGTNIDQILTVTDTRAVTTEWQDTGINSVLLPIGSYMLQMVSPLSEIVTGVMSWYPNNTNNQTADEILLHRATPDVSGTLFLRIYRSANADIDMVLQIAATSDRASNSYSYKFRRMI
jgi:hypothetical protein